MIGWDGWNESGEKLRGTITCTQRLVLWCDLLDGNMTPNDDWMGWMNEMNRLYLQSTRSRGCWVVRCSGMCINKMFLILTKITEKNGILDVLIYSSENIVHLSNQFVNTMNSNDRINPRTTQRIPYTTRQWLHGTHPTCTGFAPGFPHKRLILFPFLGLDTRFRRQTGKNNARLMHVSCKA